jgi:hypothetical protein
MIQSYPIYDCQHRFYVTQGLSWKGLRLERLPY